MRATPPGQELDRPVVRVLGVHNDGGVTVPGRAEDDTHKSRSVDQSVSLSSFVSTQSERAWTDVSYDLSEPKTSVCVCMARLVACTYITKRKNEKKRKKEKKEEREERERAKREKREREKTEREREKTERKQRERTERENRTLNPNA